MDKTTRLLKQIKAPQYEPKTPIASEMFLPNHSGIASHPEFKTAISSFSQTPWTQDIEAAGYNLSGAGKISIGTTPFFKFDAGGWTGIPPDVSSNASNIKGDFYAGNDGAGVARFRMSSNESYGFYQYNRYFSTISGATHINSSMPCYSVTMAGVDDAVWFSRAPVGSNTLLTIFRVDGATSDACIYGNARISGAIICIENISGANLQTAGNLTDGTTSLTIANAKTAYNHSQDNTQAHSDYLLNSAADVGVGLTFTGDNSSADTAYVPMVLYNTDATPPAASGFPIGTLYVQYTA